MLDIEDDLQKKGFSDFNDEHTAASRGRRARLLVEREILKPTSNSIRRSCSTCSASASGGSRNPPASPELRCAGEPMVERRRAAGPAGGRAAMLGVRSAECCKPGEDVIETLKKSVRELRLTSAAGRKAAQASPFADHRHPSETSAAGKCSVEQLPSSRTPANSLTRASLLDRAAMRLHSAGVMISVAVLAISRVTYKAFDGAYISSTASRRRKIATRPARRLDRSRAKSR